MDLKKHYDIFVKHIQNRQKVNNWNPNVIRKGYERHHLLPECKGGTWDPDNLILVTKREHQHIHWLLWKLNPNDFSLCAAWCRTKTGIQPQCYPKDSKEYKLWKEKSKNNQKDKRIAIVCLETRQFYESITKASYELDIEDTHIRECIYEYTSSCNGYHFMTKDWYDNATETDILNKLLDTPRHRMALSHSWQYWLCIESRTIYKALSIAEEYTGESANNIRRSSEYHKKTRTSYYEWRRLPYENYIKLFTYKDFEIMNELDEDQFNKVLQLCI